MEDAQLKTILDEQRQEYQRYLGVVVEGFQSNLKLIAESLGDTQEQMTDLRDLAVKNTEDIQIIKLDVGEFASLEKRAAMLEKNR